MVGHGRHSCLNHHVASWPSTCIFAHFGTFLCQGPQAKHPCFFLEETGSHASLPLSISLNMTRRNKANGRQQDHWEVCQKHGLGELTAYLMGRTARSMAFSWTCHPNRNELKAQRIRHRRKPLGPWGLNQRQKTEGNMAIRVQMRVAKGVTEGRTVCSNCWTKPLVIEALGILLGSRSFSFKPMTDSTLSTALYKAQKFGAQYAWQRPLLKGKSREKT